MIRRLLLGVVVCALGFAPAFAGVDVDFGAAVRIDDDKQLFFHISSRYFDRDVRYVEDGARLWADPDDLAVALFISQQSGKSLQAIFELRRGRLSWWDIGVRVGVPVDAWFVPVTATPGPPYGRAYGYWKKHRANPAYRFRLSDDETRHLVAVRVVHGYYGVPVEQAMAWRKDGHNVCVMTTRVYRGRHGDAKDRDAWAAGDKKGGRKAGKDESHPRGKHKS
jgi:hypothetical protein